MSTLSVPLDEHLDKGLTWLVEAGIAPNRAQAARQALEQYLEDKAVEEVLEASKGPKLKGNLKELAKKFR
jgi:Arc/MetJ-type ribon-helix-helix transcriptional regulator